MNIHSAGVALLLVGLIASASSWAQDGGEVITLLPGAIASPAYDRGGTVEAGDTMPFAHGYRTSSYMPTPPRLSTAIALRKRAESVALAITLVNDGRNAEVRNREMLDTLSKLLDQAATAPGIRVHNGVLALSTRDRKLGLLSSFKSEPATRVELFVLGDLPEGQSALEVTNRIKNFLSSTEKIGATRIVEGAIGLSIREPERFRRELLAKIIDEVHFVKTTLGDAVKVNLHGLDHRINVRQFNDTEVELSIPYAYVVEYTAK